jgi:hypothetical protein
MVARRAIRDGAANNSACDDAAENTRADGAADAVCICWRRSDRGSNADARGAGHCDEQFMHVFSPVSGLSGDAANPSNSPQHPADRPLTCTRRVAEPFVAAIKKSRGHARRPGRLRGERLPLGVGRFLDGLRPREAAGQREVVTVLQASRGGSARHGRHCPCVRGVGKYPAFHFDCLNASLAPDGSTARAVAARRVTCEVNFCGPSCSARLII